MVHSIYLPVLHGFMYIMTACLIFIIMTPRFMFAHNRRKTFFVVILAVLSFLYLGLEDIDPYIYAMHLTPVSIALAVLFEGLIPGIAAWLAFAICGIVLVGNDPIPTLSATLVLLALGLLFYYRIQGGSYLKMCMLNGVMVTVYMMVYTGVDTFMGTPIDVQRTVIVVILTLISSQLSSILYLHVKNYEDMREELVRSEKNLLIGQLAASISHEIRNPLTTTRGFLQLMSKDSLSRESFERYRDYAFEGIDHANAIITDYLNFSKPNVNEPKPLEVKQEIESIIPWLKPYSIQSNINISIQHLSEDPLFIMGEPKKLHQCLLNIMKNAIESMPQGGTLTISTTLQAGKVQILIRDTGVGMNHTQIKRIGMPYFTTKEKGTGLGLMVVMSLVKAMNGEIFFRSKPNQGTICELHFYPVPASSPGTTYTI